MKTVYQVHLKDSPACTISYLVTQEMYWATDSEIHWMPCKGRTENCVHGTLEGLTSLYHFPSYTSGNVL